jgi:hypothetical protein
MGIKFDGTIKLDLKLAIEATLTIIVLLTFTNTHQTNQVIQEIPEEVKKLT